MASILGIQILDIISELHSLTYLHLTLHAKFDWKKLEFISRLRLRSGTEEQVETTCVFSQNIS